MEDGIPDSGRSALDGLRVMGVDEPLSRAEISNPGRQKLPKAEGVLESKREKRDQKSSKDSITIQSDSIAM